MAFNTIGINLYIGSGLGTGGTNAGITAVGSLGKLPNLQEIGEIGFNAAAGSAGYDQIEVTTLADDRHVYIDGLIADSESDSNELSLKFLFSKGLLAFFKDAQDAEGNTDGYDFYAELPDATIFHITASINSIVVDTMSVGSAMTMSMTLGVKDIEIADELPA